MLTLQTPGAGLLSGLDCLPPQQQPLSPAAPSRGVGACGQVQVSPVHSAHSWGEQRAGRQTLITAH